MNYQAVSSEKAQHLYTGKLPRFEQRYKNLELSKHRNKGQIRLPMVALGEKDDLRDDLNFLPSGDIRLLCHVIQNQGASDEDILSAMKELVRAGKDPPLSKDVATNFIPQFVKLLTNANTKIQYTAVWILGNMMKQDSKARAMVDCGGVHILIQMILRDETNERTRKHCIRCVGNLAINSTSMRDKVLFAGGINALLKNISNPMNKSIMNIMLWAIMHLCSGKPRPCLNFVAPAIPYLAQLIKDKIESQNICETLLKIINIAEDNNVDYIVMDIIDTGITPHLVSLLESRNEDIIIPALLTIGKIINVIGDLRHFPAFEQTILECNLIHHAEELLSQSNIRVDKEICWLLSMIARGGVSLVANLMSKCHLMPTVITLMSEGKWEVRRWATWVVYSIVRDSNETHMRQLVDLGSIAAFCSILDAPSARPDFLFVVLNAIDSTLNVERRMGRDFLCKVKVCNGLSKIKDLQNYEDKMVRKSAEYLVEEYFHTAKISRKGEDENLSCTIADPLRKQGLLAYETITTGMKNDSQTTIRKTTKYRLSKAEPLLTNEIASLLAIAVEDRDILQEQVLALEKENMKYKNQIKLRDAKVSILQVQVSSLLDDVTSRDLESCRSL